MARSTKRSNSAAPRPAKKLAATRSKPGSAVAAAKPAKGSRKGTATLNPGASKRRATSTKRANPATQAVRAKAKAKTKASQTRNPASRKAAAPAKRAAAPAKRATAPAKRATPLTKRATPPAKRATPLTKRATTPAKRATTPAAKRATTPAKRATAPAKRATAPAAKRAATPAKRAATPAKRGKSLTTVAPAANDAARTLRGSAKDAARATSTATASTTPRRRLATGTIAPVDAPIPASVVSPSGGAVVAAPVPTIVPHADSARTKLATTALPADAQRLIAQWPGNFGGLPPLDGIAADAWQAAVTHTVALYREDIAAICAQPQPATFDNTLLALERAGAAYQRVLTVFGVYASTLATPEIMEIESALAPQMAALADEISLNADLFARVAAVHRDLHALAPMEQRLTETVYQGFVRRGALLDAAAKQQLSTINERLASLFTQFAHNELHDEEQVLPLTEEAELAGLPPELIAAARALAHAQGATHAWHIANTRSAIEPLLTFATNRDVRKRAWMMFSQRGGHAGPHDNVPIIREILQLREQRAHLLGYSNHAAWTIADNMAQTPEAARALLAQVWPHAVVAVNTELAAMAPLLAADLTPSQATRSAGELEPWDYRYYAEKLRTATYDLDQQVVKQYLQLDQLKAGMFWMAEQAYGLRFDAIAAPVQHPDVTVYEVRDAANAHVGVFYFDPFARPGKRGGAWMSEYRTQQGVAPTVRPIVSNNCNFIRGEGTHPTLLSWDDATTLFHEFGHGLHGLLSDVPYATLAGTNTKRDFVEFPSQLTEHWLSTNELLARFACHVDTGEPMPEALRHKLLQAKHAGQGFRTVEYLASALYDLTVHTMPAATLDPIAVELALLSDLGCPRAIGMRHRPPHFAHLFSSDGYAAGYYVYLWADALVADAAAQLRTTGFYDEATTERLRSTILAVGNSVEPSEAFRAFMGRDVDSQALLVERGFLSHRTDV